MKWVRKADRFTRQDRLRKYNIRNTLDIISCIERQHYTMVWATYENETQQAPNKHIQSGYRANLARKSYRAGKNGQIN